ncbi:hypothetical protein ElyMa_003843200 [Elysia marginata]|uniref:Uncharacterized protein n=1 Tax=Elysia marginata TaxID=1093978 RepID=A0AAV4FGZ1_9GAST|nr:hypothetical protein ElyMa_003843200 [Elysia marginata]
MSHPVSFIKETESASRSTVTKKNEGHKPQKSATDFGKRHRKGVASGTPKEELLFKLRDTKHLTATGIARTGQKLGSIGVTDDYNYAGMRFT